MDPFHSISRIKMLRQSLTRLLTSEAAVVAQAPKLLEQIAGGNALGATIAARMRASLSSSAAAAADET